MSFGKVYSAQIVGLKVHIVDIEIDLSRGLHAFTIIGLPDKAIEEAKDRFSAALKNSGFISPKQKNQKVVVSLAPADMKKAGPHFDLAIAIGYLLAAGELRFDPRKKLFIGELSLDGIVKRGDNVLPLVYEAKMRGFSDIFVPHESAAEAALVQNVSVFGVSRLIDVIDHLRGDQILEKTKETKIERALDTYPTRDEINIADIEGHEQAKRALEIAAAGKHNLLLSGPPGIGKTMLAQALRGILPPLSFEEMVEVSTLHGTEKEVGLVTYAPPFRSPHHTSSYSAIMGSGSQLFPGEITLAHHGVLFLDEFPEFDRRVIESLREPLEERRASISRTKGKFTFPANFIFIAAMNPCPCGNLGSERKVCSCPPTKRLAYQQKISDPIKDRIDLWVEVSHASLSTHPSQRPAEEGLARSEMRTRIRERVQKARDAQNQRYRKLKLKIGTNSELSARDVKDLCLLNEHQETLLCSLADKYGLSKRSSHRIIKIARTIADLEEKVDILDEHLLEAFQYKKDIFRK